MEPIQPKDPGDFLTSGEFNSFFRGSENAILDSAQVLTIADSVQLSRAMAVNAMASDFFRNSGSTPGSPDEYRVSTIGLRRAPLTLLDGMRVRFRPPFNNSGIANLTVAGIGPVEILQTDGTSSLVGGEISTAADTAVRYDAAAAKFILLIISVVNAQETVRGLSFFPKRIILSNSSGLPLTDIDFSAGNFIFSDGTGEAANTAFTKKIDGVFVAGTGVGGVDEVTDIGFVDTWYHTYAVFNPTTGARDFAFSLSPSAPSLVGALTPFTKHRRIGSVRTAAANTIIGFIQIGVKFIFTVPRSIASGVATPSTPTTFDMETPIGIQTLAIIVASLNNRNGGIALYSPLQPTPTIANLTGVWQSGVLAELNSNTLEILTDTASEIVVDSIGGGNLGTLTLSTWGWVDYLLENS